MIYAKIGMMCLGLIGFGGWAWFGQASSGSVPLVAEVKTKIPGVSPEVREKAFDLLDRVLVEADTLNSRQDSIQMRFLLADLLWEKDEPRARKIFASLALAADKEGCYCNIIELRTIAARDAKLALKIAESSDSGLSDYEHNEVYEYFVKQYPDEALREAKIAAESNEYLPYLSFHDNYGSNANRPGNVSDGRLEKLYSANKSYGANLASDILKKLGQAPLNVPTPYPVYRYNANLTVPANFPAANWTLPVANFANANKVANRPVYVNSAIPSDAPKVGPADKRVPFSAAASLLTLAVRSREESEMTGEVALLTEAEIKELARMMIQALAKTKRFDKYIVWPVYANLKKYAPSEMARLERALSVRQRKEIAPDYIGLRAPTPPSANLPRIKPASPQPNENSGERSERELVNDLRQFEERDWHRDAEAFVRLPNPEKYPDLMEQFKQYLPEAYAKTGNIAKLRPIVAAEPDRTTRLILLSFAANALAEKNDQMGAARLIDEASEFAPSVLKKKEEFTAVETYAFALAGIEPARGFVVAEKLLDDANRLIGISKELRDFTGSGDDESSSFESRRAQISNNSLHTIKLIRSLAHSDFDRTVKLADRFADPDQRVFFRWYIANALLNKNAEMEEHYFASGDWQSFRPMKPPGFPANNVPAIK